MTALLVSSDGLAATKLDSQLKLLQNPVYLIDLAAGPFV